MAARLMSAMVLAMGLGGAAIAGSGGSGQTREAVKSFEAAPLILIDPGHGGTNSGAPSVRPGIFEKHITLAMAGVLRARLEAEGFNVRLTRHKDTYLTLRERGRLANEMDADLMVSLHANATESHSHSGYETFILTPDAVDIDSRALRHDSGRPRPGLDADLAVLLDDIERSTSQVAAAKLAASIQSNMRVLRGTAGDRGVRQDSMHVLLGATMPAVLVEVGFIDHPIEGEQLMDAKVRSSMVNAIADAIIEHGPTLMRK
ncbi:MAG: N-acetylmuramoyl-L-alanine amidase [Myxococcales bacterium]|nr:N-acetylmuramoyl-L-alanine amidase [Myxococcales bacterium]